MKVLIAFNANVNIIDDHGRMPLHWASFNGNERKKIVNTVKAIEKKLNAFRRKTNN